MSELSERVAREHAWTLIKVPNSDGETYHTGGCSCGTVTQGPDAGDDLYDEHLAAMIEAAVRETIAADIEAMPLGTAIHRVSGRTMAHAVRTEAADIARGQQ